MKKFMIFLLMAFLYLGTCQARSEATHFDNANVKLHSWVLPSTSQSFPMDVKAIHANPIVKVTPSQPQNLCLSCPHNEAVFGMSFDDNGSGESLVSRVWMVNDHNTDSIGSTFTFGGYAAGHYTVACKVTTDLGNTYVSNYVEITVDIDVIVNIEGPDHACQNDVVTLVAQVENSSFDIAYQWRRDGQYIIGANQPTFSFLVDTLPGLTDTLAYEFDVQITRAGCDSKYSPVHYFTVSPTPVTMVDVPLFCNNEPVTLTANSYTSGSEQPYMWKWIKVGADDTTITYVNTLTISNPASNDKYKVVPIYQDFACNADTAEVTLKSYQDSLKITAALSTLTVNGPDKVCLDGMVKLTVTDPNKSKTVLGTPTYAWYMNGVLMDGVTDTICTAVLSHSGEYIFNVVASYSDYPCENPTGTKTITVDTVPASVMITGPNVLCQNQNGTYNDTTLTAVVTPALTGVTYKWTGDANFGNSATKRINGPGVYSVIIKTAGGCEAASLPFEVRGFGADVTIASTTVGCPGEPVTLTANADGWTGSVSYVWGNATNPDLSHINVLQVTATTTETAYWVTSTVNMGGGTTCTRTDTIKVKALAVPTPAPIVERVSADSICEGQLAIFRVKNASSITGVSQYVWYNNGVEIPGFNLDTIAVELTVPGMYGFQAAAFNAAGCSSTISNADSIKVKAIPALVNITGDAVICENDSTVLKVHAEGDNLTYLWSDGSKKDSLVAHAGVYSVTVSSMDGCSATAEFTVNTIGSEIQITATPSQNVCAGESVTLNVHASGWTSGNISYEWIDITNGHNNNQVTFVPTHDGYYKVTTTVESTSGTCTRTDSIYINVDTVKIDEVAYIGGDTLCLGAQATMYVKASGADHYIWYENGYAIPGQYLDTLRVQPEAPGFYTYSVAAISNTGCASKDTTIKPDLYILPNPTVQITGDQILCNDSTVRLVALLNDTTNTTANGSNGEYTYMWRLYNQNLNSTNTVTDTAITVDGIEHEFTVNYDTLTTTLTSQDHPYIFTVSVVNANGCVAESDPYNVYIGKDLFVDVTVDLDTVCEGGRVTATAHLGDYNLENLTYQWYEINKITSDTDTVASATEISYTTNVETSTVFMVKITQTTTGCTITGKDSVYVLPVKMLKVVATNETPLANETDSLFVCKGEGIYLTAYVINEETGETYIDSSFSYVWFENGRLMEGYTRPTFNKQVDIIDDDTLSYQYAAYIDFGIEGCEPQLVYSNVVFVKRNPIVTIRGNQNVCYFGTFEETGIYNIHLIAWVDGGYDTSLTYTWYEHGQVREGVGGSIYDNHYRENWIPTYDNPYSFTVMVSNSDGCVTISEPFEVNVYNKPAVNITATETTICEGGKTQLTAHIDNYNEPMLVYQWFMNSTDPDNAIPGMTESVETFWPVDTTTYIVKVTHLLENGLPDRQACFNTASYVINVNDIPVIDSVTNDLTAANDTICEGRFVTLTAHMHGGVPGGEVYTWYRNGAVIPEAHDSIYVETPAAENGDITTYNYAVSVKQTADGCESDTTQAATVTVLPNPVLTLVTDPIVCDTNDLNIMMYANVNPIPTSPYHFVWFEDNSVDTLAAAADVVFSGEHNDTVKIKREYRDYPYSFAVQMVNEYGCTVRDDALIYVNDNPVVHAISTEYNICQSEDGIITLTANLDDYNADMLEFHWYDVFNGDTTDMVAATEMSYTFRPDSIGVHNYFMTALQRNSLCIAQSNNVTVTVDSIPVIDSVTNDLADANDTICEGRYVTLTAHVHGGVRGGEVYTWYRNGAVIPNAHDSIYVETPEALNGDVTTYHYAVSVKQTAAGCESDTTRAALVTVFPNPVLTLVTDPIVCDTNDLNIMMYANVNPIPTSPYHFTWFEDNSVDTLAAAADVVYSGEHQDTVKIKREYRDYPYSFAVQMVNEFGCTTRDDALIYVNDNPIVHAISTEYNICDGGEITLTANLDDYNADMLEFHWYDVFNGDTTDMVAATEMTYTFVPDSIGTHDYFMTALQRNSLCIAQSNNVTVTVDSIPVIDSVTNDLAAANDTICEGRFVTLTAHVHGGVRGGEVYTWYRNGAVIPTAHDSIYVETPEALNGDITTYHYAVSVKQTAAGCESDTTRAALVTVFPNPVLTLVTDPIVCDTNDLNIMMYANVNPIPTSPYHFTWFEDNSVDTLAAAADVVYSGEHQDTVMIKREFRDYAYSFSVQMINEFGCTVRDNANVLVNDNPVVHAISSDYTICTGGEITLTANLDDYNADMLEFHWYDVFNGDTTDMVAATNMTYTFKPDSIGTHNYFMTAQQRNSWCIAQSNNVEVLVKVDPVIKQVVLSDYIACEGAQIRVEAIADSTTYTPRATDVYTWYRNGIRIIGATNRVLYDTPTTIDQNTQQFVYTAVVTLEEPGCTSLPVDATALTIYRNPVVAITGDQHVCETDYTFLIANVDTVGMNIGNLHYTWFINGDIRDNAAYNLYDNRFFAEHLYPRDEPYIITVNVERGDIANACSSTSAPFEVYVYPKPDVNVTAVDDITDICENGEVTLQANLGDWNAEHMTFQWYEVRTSVDSIAVDYLPGGGYVYDVVTTNYNYYIPGATGFRYTTTLAETTTIGVKVVQTNSQCYDISEYTVTVHPTPAAPVITVDNPMICSNGNARLTVTNDYSEYGTPIFGWESEGVVIPGAFDAYYDHMPGHIAGNTYNYNAIVAFTMPGCISAVSDTASVVVIPDPVVTVTAEGPTEICEGGSVTFTANPQPTTLDYNYQWYGEHNQLMNGDTNATLTVYPAAHQQGYQYVVVVNSLPGCQVVVNAPVVTVLTDPRVALSIDNASICQGGISTLNVDVTGGISDVNGIDPYTYTWYSNNNTETPFAVTNVPSLTLPDTLPVDTFAYWVEVSANTYGCASTSEHVNQYVVADPIVNIMVAPTYPETVCDGGSTLLLATVEGGVPGGETYQWNRNGIIWVGETDPTFNTGILSINDLNSYSVLVTQTAPGCMTVSDTFSVPVIETYNIAVSALNNVTVCEGGTTTLEATITNTILPNDNPTFQWYEVTEGDAHLEIPAATSARYTTSPILTAGRHTYYVAVTSQITNAHCSAESGSITTEVVNDPTVTVTTSAHDNVVCDGDVVRVNATVAPAVGEYTYNWTWTNGTNSGTYSNNEPTFTPTDLPASINGYLFNVSIVSTDVNSGCNATSNNNTYVVVMPRPVVTISANNSVVCAGGDVELTANHNASDYTGYNYEWYVNGTRVPATSQTITVPASMINEGSLSAIVNVTSSQITMDCPSSDTVNQLVQVLAQPTITLASNHLTMCEGARPTLTATVAGNNNIPMTYTWNFGGQTLTGVTGNVYQSAPLAAGIYTVNVTAESQDASLNCLTGAAADAVVLRVAETPVVGLTSADGLALCEGGSVTLTATVTNATNQIGDFTNGSIYGAYNYVWTSMNNPVVPHNNIAQPQDQITETLSSVGVYEYNVQVTPVGPMAFGCGTTTPAQPLQVVVNARPNWDAVAVNPANGNICLGEEVQLHAHITGGVVDMNGNTNGHIQWVVEFNGVASNVSNYGGDAAHTPSEAGLYTYYPTYVPYEGTILGSGCSFTNSDQVLQYVTVHELPTAAFVSGDGTILCANVSDDNAALTIHFTGTAPFIFTVVDLSDGTQTMYTSYTNDYTLYVSPNHTTQYSITTLADAYCSNGELGLSAIATIFVNDIKFDETFFVAECDADQVTINFTMISGTANSDFTVTYDNGLVVNGTISNNTATFATPNVPGDYNAVFSVGGCEYDIIVRRPVHNDDFSDGTVPFMMQRWDDVAIINNNPATNGGHTFVSYQWYRNGEPIPGAIYKNYQEEGGLNGFYSIEVVSNDADGRTMTYHTCEQYFTSNNSVKVYPVPAHVQQVVTIEFVNIEPEELEGATLDIYDVTGSIVEHLNKVEPITKIAGFKASGTYFGRITSANGETKTVKFVIVK